MKIDEEKLKKILDEDGLLGSFARLTRPIAVTMIVATVPIGAFAVGATSLFNAATAKAMAVNSGIFFNGVPGELYTLIGVIATGYIGFKSWETKGAPPPIGRPSPEASPVAPAIAAAVDEDMAVDAAWSRTSMSAGERARVVFDPRLVEEERSDGLFVDETAPRTGGNATKELSL